MSKNDSSKLNGQTSLSQAVDSGNYIRVAIPQRAHELSLVAIHQPVAIHFFILLLRIVNEISNQTPNFLPQPF